MKLAVLLVWVALLGLRPSQCEGPDTLVRTTADFFAALSDPATTTVQLNDTLAINAKDWPHTVNIDRTVLVTATAERLSTRTYVLLDFKNVAMMFQLTPGVTLTFRGIELVNHYDTVGPTFRPLRMSIGATAVFDNCVQRRRAGLPYKAAVVNMVNATRPPGVAGPQVCYIITNFTYLSTRSPQPIYVPGAVNMSDYSNVVTPDSSLAYQDLFYGGYTYTTINSCYVVDNIVSDECMAERPGTECVTLLLQQLDRGGEVPAAVPQEQQSADASEEEKKKRQIIIGVVVPVGFVLLVAVAAAALVLRRRRRVLRHRLESDQPAGPGGMEAGDGGGGKGCVPSLMAPGHDTGCVFLGLEENQQLPEWSPLAADVMEEYGEDDVHGHKRLGAADASQMTYTDPIPSPRLGGGGGEQRPRLGPASASDGASFARGSGLLRPAMSTQVPDAAGTPGAGAAGSGPGASSAPEGVAAAEGEGRQVAGSDPTRSDRGGGGGGAGPVSSSCGGSDMQAELGRMAQELRASVRDQAIKLEAVIGSGSFGTVYKGTWQGLPVAVKTLVFSASDDNRRRALQEAALCASISHPNVVATYSSELQPLGTLGVVPRSNSAIGTGPGGPDSGGCSSGERELSQILEWRLYIIQEFADGGPLRKLYGNKALWPSPGVVNMPAVVGLALGIARALSHLHAKRIIHGDLNPNNVLLKRDANEPSGYIVKVGDFGLSVMLPQNRTHLSNLRMGTMFYMCPAVVMKGQVGPPSDVFSLGVMLWELYHGRRAGIRTDQGPRYSSIFPAFPPTCPEAYRAVALHCLQRQPQNRPSAAVVELHLERLLASVTPPPAAGPAATAAGGPGGGPGGLTLAAGASLVDDFSNALSGDDTLLSTQFATGV